MNFSQHLPLSQGGGGDDSGVTGDWRPLTGECLWQLADLLAVLPVESWSEECAGGGTVADRVTALILRLETSRRALFAEASIRRLGGMVSSQKDALPHDQLLATLSRHAVERLSSRGRRSIGDLTAAVVEGLDVARAVGHPLALPGRATGAAALALATSAATPLAAVIRGRSLVATDTDWSIGRGPEIRAPAGDLVLFLSGRAGVPGG